jgi:hypothetical protein
MRGLLASLMDNREVLALRTWQGVDGEDHADKE